MSKPYHRRPTSTYRTEKKHYATEQVALYMGCQCLGTLPPQLSTAKQNKTATGAVHKKSHDITLERTPDLVRAPCPGHTLHQAGLAIWRNRQQSEACLRLLSLQLLALTWEWY